MQDKQTDIDSARARVHRLRREMQVACAELGLAHHAFERHLPPRVRTGDIAWAVEQSLSVERKLEVMTEELMAIQHLLERLEGAGQGASRS